LILTVILFLLYQISKAQVVLNGNQVCMSVEDYRKFRTIILQSDTLTQECDSIINKQEKIIANKDSLSLVKDYKIALKDSIIQQKDITIKEITNIKEEPIKFSLKEFIFGSGLGYLIGSLIFK